MDKDNNIPNIAYFKECTKGRLLESHVSLKFPELYSILKKYPTEMRFTEKLYWYYYNLTEYPRCPICGNPTKFKNFIKGYNEYCSKKCAGLDEKTKEKKAKTNIERYGVEYVSQNHEILNKANKSRKTKTKREGELIKSKRIQTCIERYGVEHAIQSKEIKERRRRNTQEKYGVDSTLQLDDVRNKQKQTKLEKYGNENYSNQTQRAQTNLERYGVENVFASPKIQQKRKQTMLERYGVESPRQSDSIKEKQKQTMIERYGVENIFQHESIKEKRQDAILKRLMDNNPYIIRRFYQDDEYWYECKCPHPNTCDKCLEKTFCSPGQIYTNRKNQNIEVCTRLVPARNDHKSNTSLEIFIKDILNEHNIEYLSNYRKLLNGKEVDIYIPSKKIAIECNGIYWHTNKVKDYHYHKWKGCKEQGVQLLTFWEDQICHKPQIVRSVVLAKLGIFDSRIGARECCIKEVNSNESNNFLDKYHMQGKVNGSIRIGLYYNEELVSIMIFGNKRKALGSKSKYNNYELYRYCCKGGMQIVGGAEKLFKHFLKYHPNCTIESFSSNDISDGELYKLLGFKLISEQKGSYWYFENNTLIRHHRYQYRKSELIKKGFSQDMTESEITAKLGLMKIYDTGQQKWSYSSSPTD